ncbi:MAG: tRNA(Met) cytidine acetyltransferase [Myxococcales bacterium]|nr:tRNA(Met) cytidine acetyltransferase [Myxococcales bacterium]
MRRRRAGRLKAVRATARALAAAAAAARHRRALVLAGSVDWSRRAAHAAVEAADLDALWIATTAPPGQEALPPDRAREELGDERAALVFDLHDGLDPEALGAAAGGVRAGGLLVFCAPPLDVLARGPSRLCARLARLLPRHGVVLGPGDPAPAIRPGPPPPPPPEEGTFEQLRAYDLILEVLRGRSPHPVVLIGDRGRGKSATLGAAAGVALDLAPRRIVVTAPRPRAVRQVFAFARRALELPPAPDAAPIEVNGGWLRFAAPERAAALAAEADAVLVDEAAALGVARLRALVDACPRLAFATTLHGYEGSGRGFALRFAATLAARTPGARWLHMPTPMRWAPDDPVEALVFEALLLDARPAPDAAVRGATPADCRFERLHRDTLAADEDALRAWFGLLVGAHYRTSPADLARALDAPGQHVYVARTAGAVVGAALVADEGGLAPDLAAEVTAGRRRPPGHLLAETLAFHLGRTSAATLRSRRVVRVAVHPAVRSRGIGAGLLMAITADARAEAVDVLGTSFGATAPLLRFWRRAGLLPVRVGLRAGKRSGEHAVVMTRALTPEGAAALGDAPARLQADLPVWLGGALDALPAPVIAGLLRGAAMPAPAATDAVLLGTCLDGPLAIEVASPALRRLVLRGLAAGAALDEAALEGLVRRTLQGWSSERLARSTGAGSAAAADRAVKAAARVLRDAERASGIGVQSVALSSAADD